MAEQPSATCLQPASSGIVWPCPFRNDSDYVPQEPKIGPRGVKPHLRKNNIIKRHNIRRPAIPFCNRRHFLGWFTANEAAVWRALALVFMIMAQVSFKNLKMALIDTAKTTAMIFMIMIGAYVFGYFLRYSAPDAAC
jgi:hypothetical protein